MPKSTLLPLQMDTSFGRHGVILFQVSSTWAVVDEDDQFHIASSYHFQGLHEPQHVLATFHKELESWVDTESRVE